jgi:hypothetical protein
VNNAPSPAIIFIEVPGDRGVWKKAQHRHHKAVRPAEPWPIKRGIPSQLDKDELRRRAQEFRDANRPHAQAMIIEARLMLRAA